VALQVLLAHLMNRAFASLLIAATIVCSPVPRIQAAPWTEAITVRTNWVDHWITNTAEIRLQLNHFVTEFHTNRVTLVETNFVDLFKTNLVTKTLTNTLVFDSFRTNVVAAYRTNFQTLHLTNWTTVLAFKTNWVTKPLTNMVEIEMERSPAPAATPKPSQSAAADSLTLQASRSSRLNNSNQVEVQLTVAWAQGANLPIQIQQWRIEREDGSILFFGQESHFQRMLPPGTYKVLVKAQHDAKGPLVAAVGTRQCRYLGGAASLPVIPTPPVAPELTPVVPRPGPASGPPIQPVPFESSVPPW
jgi:hypothetical protein